MHDEIIPNPLHSVATKYDAPPTFIAICGSPPFIIYSPTVSLKSESTNADNLPANIRSGRSKIRTAIDSSVNMKNAPPNA